jgi:hypothetical protein
MRKILSLKDILPIIKNAQDQFRFSPLYKNLEPHLNTPIHIKLVYNKQWTNEFGLASGISSKNYFEIKFNGWLLSSIEDWQDTIKHEYAHILHFIAIKHKISVKSHHWQHGQDWQNYAKAVGAQPVFGNKSCGPGVLGRIIQIESAKKKFYLTHQDYIERLPVLRTKQVKISVLKAADILDTSLLEKLSQVRL